MNGLLTDSITSLTDRLRSPFAFEVLRFARTSLFAHDRERANHNRRKRIRSFTSIYLVSAALLFSMDLHEGGVRSYERTFTAEDIRQFAEISGDKGRQHVERDAEGRLMVQGLLTATLPTKLGGDMNYIARTLEFEFVRPVFAGDTITCESEIRTLIEEDDRTLMESTFVCRNGDGEEVMRGESEGVIPAEG